MIKPFSTLKKRQMSYFLVKLQEYTLSEQPFFSISENFCRQVTG